MSDSVLADLVSAAEGEDPLDALRATAELRRRSERLEAVQVRRARVAGVSWARIAEVLGVSKQAVHKKYGSGGLFR
ncbi:hypothetical protein C1701_24935 [Actinoalloteichus sp. AHMU CJ021]|nr:hypothetical protein [Actinoalloteichus caeruleus]AUS81047.1 hypothetical protein C1701_24935 [Actinoalloteichus sp. AHMU CJ021]